MPGTQQHLIRPTDSSSRSYAALQERLRVTAVCAAPFRSDGLRSRVTSNCCLSSSVWSVLTERIRLKASRAVKVASVFFGGLSSRKAQVGILDEVPGCEVFIGVSAWRLASLASCFCGSSSTSAYVRSRSFRRQFLAASGIGREQFWLMSPYAPGVRA